MQPLLRLIDWVDRLIMGSGLLFWSAILANLLGVVIGGWYWYGPMLTAAPFWALFFIPDCPLAALLASIALIAIRYDRQQRWFSAVAAFACVKYGLWTIFFWLRHWSAGGPFDFISVAMFITHIGLTCEGILIARHMLPLNLVEKLPAIAIHALALFVDYGLIGFAVRNYGFPFFPPLTSFVPMSFVASVAIGLTIALSAALLLLKNPAQQAQREAGSLRAA